MLTLRERLLLLDEPHSIISGDFLDDFYRSDFRERYRLVQDILPLPAECKTSTVDRDLALYAGMVNKLCNDYFMENPKWVYESRFFLDQPYFAGDARGAFRIILIQESPVEFSKRNVYVTSDSLVRV